MENVFTPNVPKDIKHRIIVAVSNNFNIAQAYMLKYRVTTFVALRFKIRYPTLSLSFKSIILNNTMLKNMGLLINYSEIMSTAHATTLLITARSTLPHLKI